MRFIIPDQTGDTQKVFSPDQMQEAERVFNQLIRDGRTPIKPGVKGDDHQALPRSFDPSQEEILFIQPMKGG